MTWSSARNASASRKSRGTPSSASSQNGAVHTTANSTFVSGPAAEMRLCRHRPLIRPRSMKTAPPGSPIPPMITKRTGSTMLSRACVYFTGLSVR